MKKHTGRSVAEFRQEHDPRAVIARLEAELRKANEQSADAAAIKAAIGTLGARLDELEIPAWATAEPRKPSSPGVPTLFLSDLHWGEVVHPSQINGVNRYNLSVARARLRHTVETAVGLLRIIDSGMDYPGIVVPLGGDMVSGNIHDELQATNELNTMPTLLDLFEHLASAIKLMADTFGHVFLPCVSGNHGRDCYDGETEILTRRGWLRIDAIDRDNDEVATYVPASDTIRFEKSNGWFYDANYRGDMVSVESRGVSLLVTPEHTLWVKAPGATHTLKSGSKVYEYPFSERKAAERAWGDTWTAQCAITGWTGEAPAIRVPATARTDEMTIEPSEQWAEFLGWYVSEGCADDQRITISQSAEKNPAKYSRIALLLTELGFEPKLRWNMIRVGCSGLARFLNAEFGEGAKNKRLPAWLKNWPRHLLSAFFNAAMDGDGHWEQRGGTSGRYTSTSDALLDDMQEVAFRLGYSTCLGKRYESPVGDSGYVGTARKLGVTRTPYRSMTESRVVQYEGPIWCPRVSTGLVVVRRNGKVVISGNTKKTWAKDRNHTSFDWLLYQFLAKHFMGDPRVTFYIPDGPDAYYRVYNHRFLLTHGDQFKAGDSIIGPVGPLLRGNQKKTARNQAIGQDYETLLCGHWHQYIQLQRLIVNNSLKGYDEYAFQGNFGFEPPSQALWITHPTNGITFRMPVYCEPQKAGPKAEWVSVRAA